MGHRVTRRFDPLLRRRDVRSIQVSRTIQLPEQDTQLVSKSQLGEQRATRPMLFGEPWLQPAW